ncbi:MAG TPA: DUF3857 and transglutaminase domain-containing protein, partial [Candidatus Edwardsbacteria bacterium]|nr:DUF3857 and transglutaminase domain-containing protein [Candidatus Edwardsbacteria bacterium]
MKRCLLVLLTASLATRSLIAFPAFPAPQPLDSAGAARTLSQITPAKYPGATAVIAYDRQREEYTGTGTSVLERAVLVKTLSELGVRDWAQLRVSYSPQYDRAEFLWARLIKASGEIIPLAVDSVQDTPQPAAEWGTIFWGDRDKTLTVLGLEPGDAVEYATRGLGGLWRGPGSLRDSLALLDQLATPYRGQFNRLVMFQDDQPVREMSYAVSGPNTLPLKFAVFNGALDHDVSADSFTTTHRWSAHDVPAVVDEPRMPSRYDVGLKLIVTTVPSWEWMSRFDYDQADSCLRPDQAIRDKAAELTAGLADDRSKVRALCYYVAHTIRYLGLAVGDAEGYQPHPARMTFVQKAGVCKDKAGLLVALLNAAGFRAWYTTTAAGNRIEDIPADQANHAIVAFEDGRGGIDYCDPTMATETMEVLPAFERRQQVLIARPEGDRLRQIPLLPADSNRLEVSDRCAIDTLGNITGTLTLRGSGGQDDDLRGQFWQPRPAWDRIALDIVRQLGTAASVTSFTHTDPDSF